jgi:predicted Zn-dependent protease
MENDDQLFAVLAHEVAHIEGRHALLFDRTYRKRVVGTRIALLSASLFGVRAFAAMMVVSQSVEGPDRTGLRAAVFGYGSKFEPAADDSSLAAMEHARRDSRQLLRLAQILDDLREPDPTGFLWEVHPTAKERAAHLAKRLGSPPIPEPPQSTTFLQMIRPIILQNIQLDIDTRCFRSAVAVSQRLAEAIPADSVAHYWLGESYRTLGPRQNKLTQEELTPKGQRAASRRSASRTEAEEAAQLAATKQGKAALQANREIAEREFRSAIRLDGAYADPYFGLGQLYQDEHRNDLATEAFRSYAALSPNQADKDRAARHIEEINRNTNGANR